MSAEDGGGGHLEREVKLAAWPGFELPAMDGVLPWVRQREVVEQELDATYHDTADLRLVRRGVTLRHRSGEGPDRWTLKLPDDVAGRGAGDGVAVRTEHDVEAPPDAVPRELAELVRASVRTAELVVVAHLVTRRRHVVLIDGGGRVVGAVDDDEVSVLDGAEVALRFREVEAELQPGVDPGLLDALADRLVEAGARRGDATPKLVRALGPRAIEAPEATPPELGRRPSVGRVVHHAIAASVGRILEHDPLVRLGAGVEAVHQARVGTRRLRSDLRTFAPVLAEGWADGLRDELSWLADALGQVRDADVLAERLARAVAGLSLDDRLAAQWLLERVAAQRAEAGRALAEVMASPRYLELLDRLVDAAADPRLGADADRPAADVLPELVRKPWEKLDKAVRHLDRDPADEELHAVRIRAKRARYAAEAAAAVLAPAGRHGKAIAEVQGVLGDHNDAVVAEGWLRQAALEAGGSQAMVAGILAAAERAEAEHHRAAWADAWRSARRPKRRAWLE